MKKFVVMSGGFHPFHAGHASLYQQAKEAFPDATVLVCATNVQTERPFPFKIKQKLAQLSGVPPKDFIEVSRQFSIEDPALAQRIGDPNKAVVIFVRSDKDKNEPPIPWRLGPDGKPPIGKKGKPLSDRLLDYPGDGKPLYPASKHVYIDYLKTVEFGPGITSASEIRKEWPTLDEKTKLERVVSLYPATQKNPKLAQSVVKIFDQVIGEQISEEIDNSWDEEEFLPARTSKMIAKQAFSRLYPDAKVNIDANDEGDGSINIETADGEFGLLYSCSKQEGEIIVFVENAYAGKYKGIVQAIIGMSFIAAKKLWGNPPKGMVLIPNDDKSDGYWQDLANKMGVKYSPNTVYGEKVKDVEESLGNNYPETYEEENKPFMHKGGYRITAMTSESVDYLEEK